MDGLNIRRFASCVGPVLLACCVLPGCASKTNVAATGDVPAQYAHLFVTTQEIWFNTSATAGPEDTAWIKFPLTTPVTVDLAAAVDGTVTQVTTGLAVPAGSYAQIRLIPVDSGSALSSSAQSLGALYNSEVDYYDSAGALHQTPLELQNPDKGIGIATTLSVKANTEAVFGTSSSSTTTASTTASTSTPTPLSLAINLDGSRDLVPFTYSGVSGVLLNPHQTAFDTSAAGAVTGSLTITGLTGITSANTGTGTYVDIQVTAESLSADGTRHVAVNSAPVNANGTFTLYPLATTSSTPASYDLVVHGPGIATIIIKGVTVNVGDPTTTTPVSIGTVVPRAATSYTVNLVTTNPLQAGALVSFYQTLPGTSEVPYLIEERPIDPFNRNFAADQSLSSENLDYGTFASGSTVVLTTGAAPTEGASTYRVSATAPLFADGILTSTVSAPAASSGTAVLVAVPVLSVATGAVANTLSISVSQTAAAGTYDKGEVILSHDGAIVATAALDAILAQRGTGTLTFTGLPGGTASSVYADGLYYVSVRAWNSSNTANTLNREIYATAADLRSGSVSGYSVSID